MRGNGHDDDNDDDDDTPITEIVPVFALLSRVWIRLRRRRRGTVARRSGRPGGGGIGARKFSLVQSVGVSRCSLPIDFRGYAPRTRNTYHTTGDARHTPPAISGKTTRDFSRARYDDGMETRRAENGGKNWVPYHFGSRARIPYVRVYYPVYKKRNAESLRRRYTIFRQF